MRELLVGGFVHTTERPDCTALLIVDGSIAWIGDDDSAAVVTADVTTHLGGAFVAPAFVDAHAHLSSTGWRALGPDLTTIRSSSDLLELVATHSGRGTGRPVVGFGWDRDSWSGDLPTRDELDRATGGAGVLLVSLDQQSALTTARVGTTTDAFVTGAAHDTARIDMLNRRSESDRAAARAAGLAAAAAAGIASVHEMAGPTISSTDDAAALIALSASGLVPEVVLYWAELNGVDSALALGAHGAGGDLFCDGSLGARTAALTVAYADNGTLMEPRLDPEEIGAHLVACGRANLSAGFHAVGDAALDAVLAGVELAIEASSPISVRGGGHRVEHAVVSAGAEQLDRLATSGLLASVQPGFDAAWGGPNGMYSQRLGVERAMDTNAFAAMAAAGVPLAFGSDSPTTAFDPWGAIRSAVYPRSGGAGLSPRAAFGAHTRGGRRAAGDVRPGAGVLVTGAPATFTIWSVSGFGEQAVDERRSRWSTDPRAGIPDLPSVEPGVRLPTCLRTVRDGVTIHDVGALDG